MQIVADRGMDMSADLAKEYGIHFAPLRITLDEKTYSSGEDLSPDEFYRLLTATESFPTTSQPSVGDFVTLYRKLAETDPDILSIHISSGLSGTIDAARAAVPMVPEANVTMVDSKTLSCPYGWQVEAAARTLRAGWELPRILDLLKKIRKNSEGLFTLANLNYLIHGGRISHLKGLIASLLNIKPIIGVDETSGKYITHGQEITLKRAMNKLAHVVAARFPGEKAMRVQLLHGQNPEAVEFLCNAMKEMFDCEFLPTVRVAPVLGAHTGPSLVGLSVGPKWLFDGVPA